MKKRQMIILCFIVLFFAANITFADINHDLVAYYSFDNYNANDESGNGYNGNIIGNVQWEDGKNGSAISFNGTDSFIELPDPGEYTEATVGGWIKWQKFNKWSRFFDFGKFEAAFHVGNVENTNKLFYDLEFIDETNVVINFNLIEGEWYHIMLIVSNNSGAKLYLNGQLVSESPHLTESFNNLSDDSKFYLGKSNWEVDLLFNGVIDEFRIYNRSLTKTEIQELYNQWGNTCSCTDSDGDGVIDQWDECSDTKAGSAVYSNGCASIKGDMDNSDSLGLEDSIGILQVLTGLRND